MLTFDGDLPALDLNTSLCGPVVMPGLQPQCDLGMCIEGSHPWIGSGFGIGAPAPGRDRPTVRLFEPRNGRLNVTPLKPALEAL